MQYPVKFFFSPNGRKGFVSAFRQVVLVLMLVFILVSCGKAEDTAPPAAEALQKAPFSVFIVLDTVDDWSAGVRDGFTKRLDSILAATGRRAAYTVADTGLNPATAEEILNRIRNEKPDLVVAAVYPNGFAALTILQKL